MKEIPLGGKCLASSPACYILAMTLGKYAASMQFHIEVERDTTEDWVAIPSYAKSLVSAFGHDGTQSLKKERAKDLNIFKALVKQFYVNWRKLVARS